MSKTNQILTHLKSPTVHELYIQLIDVSLPDVTDSEAEVLCVFMENCILPCSFQSGRDVVIHWIQLTAGNLPVHSYFYSQDQLTSQGHRFEGRTSLFKDQIAKGNASLRLTGVQVQDQGRYSCYTSTIPSNKDSFIDLKVENSITCSSEGIYPEPELTWSTNPPSNMNTETATIPCTPLNNPFSGLVWRFNHSQIILIQTDSDASSNISEQWMQHVQSVSESGSLTIQALTPNQEGRYTCELSDAEETHISNTHLHFQSTEKCKVRKKTQPAKICVFFLQHEK
uniref:Ig-like domain-containing protein n=1 Tax=Anabas testudineus TaxID=64144 RepID=A0A3Q1JB48_ANATE